MKRLPRPSTGSGRRGASPRGLASLTMTLGLLAAGVRFDLVGAGYAEASSVCGNGALERSEECDDGNRRNGDCCSERCTFERDGNPCDDGLFCTSRDVCRAGVCQGAGNACEDGDECTRDACEEAEDICVYRPVDFPGRCDPESHPQVLALRSLQRSSVSPLEASFVNGVARALIGQVPVQGASAAERATDFVNRFRDLYAQWHPRLELRVREVENEGETGEESVLFYQTFRGVPVFAAELRVSMGGGRVFSAVGGLLPDTDVDVIPSFPEQDAEAMVRASAGPAAELAGPTTLVIFDRGLLGGAPSDPRLAWRIVLRRSEVGQFFIDAHSGEVLARLPSSFDHGLDFDVQDAENEADPNDDSCYDLSNDPLVCDETGISNAYKSDVLALSACQDTHQTWAWFHQKFNRHSYDNDGSLLEVFIRPDSDVSSATWSSYCELISMPAMFVDFEIMVHEFTHGVIQDTSELPYACESGALNESYSDVMAALADREQVGSSDWTIAEGSAVGPIRSLKNPEAFCDPDHVSIPTQNMACGPDPASEDDFIVQYQPCPAEVDSSNDYGGVHSNSGIPNKTAQLMVEGGTHKSVTTPGMGHAKTRALKYRAMRKIPSASGFEEAMHFEIAMAKSFADNGTHGFTEADVCTVRNAWAAVGKGNPDHNCDGTPDALDDHDGDGVKDSYDNCPTVPNPDQKNSDDPLDYFGDACDDDPDNDGLPSDSDPCPTVHKVFANDPAKCEDFDGDGVLNDDDNCLFDPNPDQKDSNGDGEGDACEVDTDADGTPNNNDNCPVLANADQANGDGDCFGDACDKCPHDPDPVCAFSSWGWAVGQPYQPDSDGDGIPDACDAPLYMNGDILSWDLLGPGTDSSVEIDPAAVANRHIFSRIGVCRVGGCPSRLDPSYAVKLSFQTLHPAIRAWISDEDGKSVKKDRARGGERVISFRPEGGRDYFLNFHLGSQFTEPDATFGLRIDACLDADGDGFGGRTSPDTSCPLDCDDADPANFPGNDEVCDGLDNDCDGLVDESFDRDGDGVTSCGGDCDDGDPDNFPGNRETCDFRDNDCDGEADENDVTSPTVEIVRPRDGATYVLGIEAPALGFRSRATAAGPLEVEAHARDECSGVDRVEFFVDGILRHTAATPPYRYTYSPAPEEAGEHAIECVAHDRRGNRATDQTEVFVVNP